MLKGLSATLLAAAGATLLGAATPAPRPMAPPAPAAAPAAATAFVRAIYAHYPAPEGGPYFNPTEGPQAARLFDASLLALLRRAQSVSEGEVVSGLDADYFCMCQDDGGLRWRIVSVASTDATHATATVRITWQPTGGNVTLVRLMLVLTPQGWRIHDITSGASSWRADLAQGYRDGTGH